MGLIGIHWRGRFIELVPWNGLVRCVFDTNFLRQYIHNVPKPVSSVGGCRLVMQSS